MICPFCQEWLQWRIEHRDGKDIPEFECKCKREGI